MEHALSVGLHYYVFPLLCQAIELLGAFYDPLPFDNQCESENRFTRGLKKLFPDTRYRNNQKMFFRHLRGNMIHQLRPGTGFVLSSEKHNNMPRTKHLKKVSKSQRILVIEQFFDDLKEALNRFLKDIERNDSGLDKKKLQEIFFTYGPLNNLSINSPKLTNGVDLYSTQTASTSGRMDAPNARKLS
jgi:hypothetical protein